MEVMTLQHISHAVSQSLTLMEFSEEEMDVFQEYSPQSFHLIHQAVGCRLHWRRIQLTELTDRQERQSRWILDQQALMTTKDKLSRMVMPLKSTRSVRTKGNTLG
jgi:hypothetical protein